MRLIVASLIVDHSKEDGYRQTLEQYGSADSGATIGNALGQAMQLAMEKANNKL